jgi:HD-GYP domain-containing protein (c-di-GMP phosphodiesterase class II)
VTERIRGNIAQSLKAEAAGLSLAQEIGDLQGQASALANLAAHAVLSARFDEALQLSELAAQVAARSSSLGPLAIAHVIRGNALLYLGHYEDALDQACKALLAVGPGVLVPDKRRVVLAKALAAESLIAMGRARDAAVPVNSAERWAAESGAWALVREARRVRALLDVASGEVETGLAALRELRKDLAAETPSLLMDLLQSEFRARTMSGDHNGALDVLKELRSHFLAQAEQTLKGLTEAPALTPYLQQDRRLAEIDRYLESKKLLTRVVCPATNSWEYLVSLAASSISPEDESLEHGFRVGQLARLVASSLRLGKELGEALVSAGLVHDVGKVGVPTELLLKREPLSEAELAIYDAHAEVGAQLLEQAEFPGKRIVVNAARYHHATFDGLGSRSPIRAENIPLEARIISVCDAFDGLVTGRPRQAAISVELALEHVFRRSGRDFDPKVVDALVNVIRQLPSDAVEIVNKLTAGADDIPYFASRRALRNATASA